MSPLSLFPLSVFRPRRLGGRVVTSVIASFLTSVVVSLCVGATVAAQPFEAATRGAPSESLIADPAVAGAVWSVGAGGVRTSADAGATWESRRDGLRMAPSRELAIDPESSARLASVSERGAPAQVLLSDDGGRSWRSIPLPFLFRIDTVAFGSGGQLYVLGGDGLFRSADDGRSWRRSAIGVGAFDLAVVPSAGADGADVVLLTTESTVSRSADGGVTFVDLGEAPGVLRPSSADPSVLFLVGPLSGMPSVAAVRRSADAGLSWNPVDTPVGVFGVDWIADDPSAGNHLVLALDNGSDGSPLVESHDAGATWQAVTTPFAQDRPHGLVLRDGVLLVSYGLGEATWRRDVGGTWSRIETLDAGLAGEPAFDPSDPARVWVLVDGRPLRSTDGGTSWNAVDLDPQSDLGLAPDEDATPRDLAIDAGGTLWLLVEVERLDKRLFTSDDDGATWTRRGADLGRFDAKLLTPGAAPGRLRLVLSPTAFQPGLSPGVWRTDDGGASWQLELSAASTGQPIDDLVADPRDAEHLYLVLGARGLHEKPGVDAAWRPLSTPTLRGLAVGADGRLYGRAFGTEVWLSDDGGATWRSRRLLPQSGLELHDIAASRLQPGLAVAVGVPGMLVTTDGGASWNRLETVTPSPPLGATFDAAAPSRLWLSTQANGLQTGTVGADDSVASGRSVLRGGRFAVEVAWRDFENRTGDGTASVRSDDTGTFWFFGPDNLELMVKVLDGRSVNGHWWVFFGALSNVELTVTILDLETGERVLYDNPLGEFASFGDVEAIADPLPLLVEGAVAESLTASATESLAGGSSLTVPAPSQHDTPTIAALGPGGRFHASITWRDFDDRTGEGRAVELGDGEDDDTGAFWFFAPKNLEVMVKVLDGRAINDRWWVFFGSLSNVEFTLRIEDTATGAAREYVNPLGAFASRGDVDAF